jgi:hypothetical protein
MNVAVIIPQHRPVQAASNVMLDANPPSEAGWSRDAETLHNELYAACRAEKGHVVPLGDYVRRVRAAVDRPGGVELIEAVASEENRIIRDYAMQVRADLNEWLDPEERVALSPSLSPNEYERQIKADHRRIRELMKVAQ